MSALSILAIFSLSGAAAVWYGLGNERWFESSVAAVLFIIFFAIASTLIRERMYFAVALAVPFVVALFETGSPSWPWLILTVAFLLMWWGYRISAGEKKVSPGATPRRLLVAGFSTFMTGVALCGALLYYVHHEAPMATVLIPRPVFDFTFPYIAKISQNMMHLPAPVDPNERVDDFLRQLLTSQLGTQPQIPISISSGAINENIKLEREGLSNQLGMSLNGSERVSDVLYSLINAKGETLLGPYANILGYVLAGGIFFGIKAVSFLLFYLSLGFVYVLIAIAKPLGLIKVEEETITVRSYSL